MKYLGNEQFTMKDVSTVSRFGWGLYDVSVVLWLSYDLIEDIFHETKRLLQFNLVPININTIIKLIVCLSLTSHVLKSFKFTSSDLLMIILMLPNLSNKEKTPSPRPPRALGSSMSVPQLRATVEVRPRTRALELPFQLSSRVENYVDLRKRQKTV